MSVTTMKSLLRSKAGSGSSLAFQGLSFDRPSFSLIALRILPMRFFSLSEVALRSRKLMAWGLGSLDLGVVGPSVDSSIGGTRKVDEMLGAPKGESARRDSISERRWGGT